MNIEWYKKRKIVVARAEGGYLSKVRVNDGEERIERRSQDHLGHNPANLVIPRTALPLSTRQYDPLTSFVGR